MNNLTRYNFILMGLKKEDFKKFDRIVADSIAGNLLAEGAPKDKVDKYMENCTSAVYRTSSERGIISQINEMVRVALYRMEGYEADGIEPDVYGINRELNHYIMLKLSKAYSGVTMLEALDERVSVY